MPRDLLAEPSTQSTTGPRDLLAPTGSSSASQGPDTSFLGGHPILKGVSDFLGLTGLGKGISQAIFFNLTPEGRWINDQLKQGKISPDELNYITGGGVATNKEVLGSAAQT